MNVSLKRRPSRKINAAQAGLFLLLWSIDARDFMLKQ
jgi:hypothetical protein